MKTRTFLLTAFILFTLVNVLFAQGENVELIGSCTMNDYAQEVVLFMGIEA